MLELLGQTWSAFTAMLSTLWGQEFLSLVWRFFPFVLLFELPLHLIIFTGVIRHVVRRATEIPCLPNRYPTVSCVVTCYSEGEAVRSTVESLTEQLYPGRIEMFLMVDGARKNIDTLRAARSLLPYVQAVPNRELVVVPKWQRGGRVSSLNTGLALATGEIVMALDGDTSFDNDMVASAVRRFDDPDVVGLSGSLRVRNADVSAATRMQALEYLLSIHCGKTGLSEFNVVNNISGAFGVFRRSFLAALGGWDTGTAEDLDLTLRIKNYFGRHPRLRIVFEPRCVGHTDAPDSWRGFFLQRLRWDGDLYFLYIRKHRLSFSPSLIGLPNLIMLMWNGLFFQLIMPFIIVGYYLWALAVLPIQQFLALQLLTYLFYLGVSLVYYVLCLLCLSERPRQDLRLLPWLPLLPFFTFSTRVWNALSTLREIVLASHLDSAMAPWWVLRKGHG